MQKLMLVDDSRAALLSLCQQLDANHFFIQMVQSATEAFKLLETSTPHCIVTNYEMPEIDGPSFCRQLKANEIFRYIPVIILTSSSETEHLLNAIDAGADDFISKDSDIRIITAKIHAVLRMKDYQDELTKLRRVEGIKQIITTYNHEFNNPLTIAIGNLNWLRKNSTDAEQLIRIERLSTALKEMVELVKKIRDLRDYVEATYTGNEKFIEVHNN